MSHNTEIGLDDLLEYLCYHEDPDWKPDTLEEAYEHAHEAFCHAVMTYLDNHPEVEELDGNDCAFYDSYREILEEEYVLYVTEERYQKEYEKFRSADTEGDLESFYDRLKIRKGMIGEK